MMVAESVTAVQCKYCKKPFRRESTLTAHLCEPKRRWQQESETGVQLGLRAYLRFYELSQGSAKFKSYTDFVVSPYDTAFVKFGRYCQDIRCVNFQSFLEWLLKHNKKLDFWCSDKLYTEWLSGYLTREAVQDALERALAEMQRHADDHPELRNGFCDYFRYSNANRVCHHVSTGRISAWTLYNCQSGIEFLESLSQDQIEVVLPWIDPDFWQKKFRDHGDDTAWAKHILKQAGL